MNCLFLRSVILFPTAEHRRAENFPHISHKQVASVITAIQRYLGITASHAREVKHRKFHLFYVVKITLLNSCTT